MVGSGSSLNRAASALRPWPVRYAQEQLICIAFLSSQMTVQSIGPVRVLQLAIFCHQELSHMTHSTMDVLHLMFLGSCRSTVWASLPRAGLHHPQWGKAM